MDEVRIGAAFMITGIIGYEVTTRTTFLPDQIRPLFVLLLAAGIVTAAFGLFSEFQTLAGAME